MTSTPSEAFLAGERPDHVALFFAEGYLDADALAERGERVGGTGSSGDAGEESDGDGNSGVVLVVPGEQGRAAFSKATGLDAMTFAQRAGGREGSVSHDLAGGRCPERDADESADHRVQFVFAFVQEETPEAGGTYAEGDVVHAYASCACGTAFSERWLAGD